MAFFAIAMLFLTHTAQNGVKTIEILPQINPDPVYVECKDGEELKVSLTAQKDFQISGFQVLIVNVSEESKGTLRIALTDKDAEILMNQVVPVETIEPGKWVAVPANVSFVAEEEYSLSILADGNEPYFMQVPEGWGKNLPFEVKVWQKEQLLPCGISLGINQVESEVVTYGDIFYYSIPICIMVTAILLLGIWFGFDSLLEMVKKIPINKWVVRYGNDVFLIILFGAVCISIYSRAYLNGIYISADSTGYMREAINMVNGNGFQYDGLAGYRSWFANWPILYPMMIACVMWITNTNAYLASKLVSMVIVAAILVVFRIYYKKDAWIYALCLTNIGFLNLCYYTWSEIPFMLFQMFFALALAQILQKKNPSVWNYILLGIMGLGCFLTRYYGIYVWIVTGIYILGLFILFIKRREKYNLNKAIRLTITAFISGVLSIAYLLMNKLMNGMASGVSRTMWWDDYRKLTDDLIESLLVEFFNVFSMQIPELIENFPYHLKVFVVFLILIGLGWFYVKNYKPFTTENVMITMAVLYYVIFICIRYVSSMDSFYFRFFEPATFLLCIGMIGLLLPYVKGKKVFSYFAGATTVIIILSVIAVFENGGMDQNDVYYKAITEQWDEAYEEVPQKSVIIFNDIDYRASWYRPDVVDGTITPLDTLETLRETYYGSEYLCIKAEFVKTMLESKEYEKEVHEWLETGLSNVKEDSNYVVLSLR